MRTLIDRLEFPLPFLESMRANFLGPGEGQAEALHLIDGLADAIRTGSRRGVVAWVDHVRPDAERLGSAFLVVYRFAADYVEGWPPG